MGPAQERLKYLDGMRALAVLAVIVWHAVAHARWAASWLSEPMRLDPTWFFATLVAKGAHGVDLFFVLSGFCLSYPVLARVRRDGGTAFDVGGFFAKRIVRIVPPFYLAILFTYALVAVVGHFGLALPSSISENTGPLDFLKMLLFFDRGTYLTNVSFWTLFVEFRWYLFFPLALALYVRNPRAFVTLMVACVVAYNFTTLRTIDVAVLPAFMLGIVAADWHIVGHRLERYAVILTAVFFDVALLLEPFAAMPSRYGEGDEAGFFQQTNPGWQLASFFLIVAVGRTPALKRIFEAAPLRATGVAAYSIYLVHQPLVNLWTDSIAPAAGPLQGFCGSVVIGLAGGFLFYFVGERPFVTDPLRARLVRGLREPLARALALCGLPIRLALGVSRAQGFVPAMEGERPALEPVAVTSRS